MSLLYVEGGLLMGAITLIVVSTLYFSAEINLSLHALKMAIDNIASRRKVLPGKPRRRSKGFLRGRAPQCGWPQTK